MVELNVGRAAQLEVGVIGRHLRVVQPCRNAPACRMLQLHDLLESDEFDATFSPSVQVVPPIVQMAASVHKASIAEAARMSVSLDF